MGRREEGRYAASGRSDRVLVTVHPCGKALAGVGGFVCCSEKLKQYLVNRARTFIFSTALPPYVAAQMRAVIRVVALADRERTELGARGTFLRQRLRGAGFDIGQGDTHIVPIFLGENDRAIRFAAMLGDAGFGVRAIRPPSVPSGTSRLRISLNAKLSMDALALLADTLISIREHEQAHLQAARP